MGEEVKRGKMSDEWRLGKVQGVIEEGFPSLMRKYAGVEDGRQWKERRKVAGD